MERKACLEDRDGASSQLVAETQRQRIRNQKTEGSYAPQVDDSDDSDGEHCAYKLKKKKMMMKHFLTAKMAFCKDSNLSHQTQISHHQRPLFLHQITTTHQDKKKNKQTQKSLHCRRREMGLDGTNQTKKDRFCLCLKDRYFDFYLKLFLKGCECVSLCL